MKRAVLVWDGGSDVFIPSQMGEPREDQMQGTPGERLSELAGRVCYDSLGRGRASNEYHNHILDVGHGSVYEHFNRTFELKPVIGMRFDLATIFPALVNRRGVWVETSRGLQNNVRITMDIRAILEWDRRRNDWLNHEEKEMDLALGRSLQYLWNAEAPQIVPSVPDFAWPKALFDRIDLVQPMSAHEKWISLLMTGSRGFSHELVRHGDETGISQRSTRYVDEAQSEWEWHPLVKAFLEDKQVDGEQRLAVSNHMRSLVVSAKGVYTELVETLEEWLLRRMPESDPYRKQTARKQARGAARGALGNALQTELVFSASVAQWQHMLRMRAADAADAEIRVIFGDVLNALKESRYGADFAGFELEPASDGVGMSLVGGGAK
jgi:thymidylate synthase ThyX